MPTTYPREKTAKRGYGGRWQRERLHYLAQHPLCVMCQAEGRIAIATVVDHIRPHKGDPELMWSRDNWQALCKPHHDVTKHSMETGGKGTSPRLQRTDGW